MFVSRTEDTRRIWRVDNPTGKIPTTAEQRYEHQLKWRDCPWPEEKKPESSLPKAWGGWTWSPSGIVRTQPPRTFLEIVDEMITARDLPPRVEPALRSKLETTTALTPAFDAQTCVHEASHAIVSDEIGQRVAEVLVREDGSGLYSPDSAFKSPDQPMRESVVDTMAAVAAGRIGEKLKFGSASNDADVVWRVGTRPELDEEAMQALPRLLSNEDPAKLRAEAEVKAELILRRRWDDVLKVAAALEQRGKLTGAEFYQLLGKSAPTSDRWREALDKKYGAAAVDQWLREQGYTNLLPPAATQVRRVEMPLATRSLEVRSTSFDAARNTVEILWSSGADVKRQSYDGPYWEVLEMGAANVRLDFFNSGKAPFLNSHRSGDTQDVLGNIIAGSVYLRDGKGYAQVQLSTRASAAETIADIKAGVLRNVSIGYRYHRVVEEKAGADGIAIMRVVDFEPLECSICAIPADQQAEIRTYECDVVDAK